MSLEKLERWWSYLQSSVLLIVHALPSGTTSHRTNEYKIKKKKHFTVTKSTLSEQRRETLVYISLCKIVLVSHEVRENLITCIYSLTPSDFYYRDRDRDIIGYSLFWVSRNRNYPSSLVLFDFNQALFSYATGRGHRSRQVPSRGRRDLMNDKLRLLLLPYSLTFTHIQWPARREVWIRKLWIAVLLNPWLVYHHEKQALFWPFDICHSPLSKHT